MQRRTPTQDFSPVYRAPVFQSRAPGVVRAPVFQSREQAGLRLHHQLAILQEEDVIYVDLAAARWLAQVADHIPVQRGDVLAAGLGIAVAHAMWMMPPIFSS